MLRVRAVVLAQFVDPGAGIGGEMLERGRVRAPKAVQRLVEIADEHHVLVILAQREGDGVLRPVHVLALVHDDVREAACQQAARVLLLRQ